MNERTLPFQGLRVLMIMGVMCLHTYQYPVFGAGEELVSFFFVLSGFLYKDKLSWKSFMLHKFKQIFPFYWICLGIVLFISFIRGAPIWKSTDLIYHLFLVQSWIPKKDLSFAFGYVGAAWFLSSLWFCYLLTPFLYKLINSLSLRKTIFAFVLLYVLICICRCREYIFTYGIWMAYVSPLFRLCEYMMGMLLVHYLKGKSYKPLSNKVDILSILTLILYCSIIKYQLLGGASSIAHSCMIAYVYCLNSKVIHLFLSNKIMVCLACYSLVMYLTHQSITLSILRPHISNNEILLAMCVVLGIGFAQIYNMLKK